MSKLPNCCQVTINIIIIFIIVVAFPIHLYVSAVEYKVDLLDTSD